MECKKVKQWIMDSSAEDLDGKEGANIGRHISECPECASLWDDLKKIRLHLNKIPQPVPSEEVLKRTRSVCRARLRISPPSPSVPKYIWMAFAALVILTGVWMVPLSRELRLDQPLSLRAVGVLVLMIQNAVMLFFAPVLIRKFHRKHRDHSRIRAGRNALTY